MFHTSVRDVKLWKKLSTRITKAMELFALADKRAWRRGRKEGCSRGWRRQQKEGSEAPKEAKGIFSTVSDQGIKIVPRPSNG